MKSQFKPKPIKTTRTKWGTTLGKRKSWETRALSKIKVQSPTNTPLRQIRTDVEPIKPITRVNTGVKKADSTPFQRKNIIVNIIPNDSKTQELAKKHIPQSKPTPSKIGVQPTRSFTKEEKKAFRKHNKANSNHTIHFN